MRLLATLILIFQFALAPLPLALASEPQSASEYLVKGATLEKIISVQLLGAVNKPGMYYVPADTDLIRLLTLAGGFSSDTSTDEVILRRQSSLKLTDQDLRFAEKSGASFKVDIERLVESGNSQTLRLAHEDLVYVPKKEPLIGNDMVRMATVVSVILSAVLTGILIDDRISN